MSRRDDLLKKTNNIPFASDIPLETVSAHAADHKPRSGQGAFAVRQRLEDRVKELEQQAAQGGGTTEVPVDAISPNPWQPRRVFDQGALEDLAHSIEELGLVQPVVLRRVQDSNAESVSSRYTYQLIAGERRWRAHKMLSRGAIKALVLDVSDEDMAAYALAENIAREDLSAYEVAVAIKNAQDQFPSKADLAKRIGYSRTDLYKFLAFFRLPQFVLDDLDVAPGLIGREAARNIAQAIEDGGQPAVDALAALWPRIKTGDILEGRAHEMILATAERKAPVQTGRDIKKLFVERAQVGSITRDAAGIAIKIKAAALSADRETELREFVERLLQADKPD